MNYKVEAWSWCADYCKKNQWNPHDSYFWNKANLEYRRQHNIFEVGDWVFPVVRIIDEIEGVGRYICAEKGELVVVREVKNKGAYCSHEHRLDNSFYMKFSEFRHATDEEIKAGKRLEVNQ